MGAGGGHWEVLVGGEEGDRRRFRVGDDCKGVFCSEIQVRPRKGGGEFLPMLLRTAREARVKRLLGAAALSGRVWPRLRLLEGGTGKEVRVRGTEVGLEAASLSSSLSLSLSSSLEGEVGGAGEVEPECGVCSRLGGSAEMGVWSSTTGSSATKGSTKLVI